MDRNTTIQTTASGGDEECGTAQKEEQPVIQSSKMASRRRTMTLFFVGLALVGVLVAAITVPIVKNNQKQRSSSSSSSTTTSAAGLEEGVGNKNEAKKESFAYDPSVPEGTPTLVVTPGTGTGTGAEAISPVAGHTASTTDTSGVVSYEPLWKGVSNSIGLYDASVVQGYANTTDFQADVMAVAKMMINLVVARSTGPNYYGNNNHYYPSKGGMADEVPLAAPSPAGAAMPTVGNDVNDFGSNNQEDDVEEGDKIVSDGTRGMLFVLSPIVLRV
jgi:hypothetical protein